jgi:hypothetical protein
VSTPPHFSLQSVEVSDIHLPTLLCPGLEGNGFSHLSFFPLVPCSPGASQLYHNVTSCILHTIYLIALMQVALALARLANLMSFPGLVHPHSYVQELLLLMHVCFHVRKSPPPHVVFTEIETARSSGAV